MDFDPEKGFGKQLRRERTQFRHPRVAKTENNRTANTGTESDNCTTKTRMELDSNWTANTEIESKVLQSRASTKCQDLLMQFTQENRVESKSQYIIYDQLKGDKRLIKVS